MGQFDGIDEDYDVEPIRTPRRRKKYEEKYPFLRFFRILLCVQGLVVFFLGMLWAGRFLLYLDSYRIEVILISISFFYGGIISAACCFALSEFISWLIDVEEHLR